MATKPNNKPDPSATSAAYNFMRPKWDMIEHLLGGTSAMREAAEAYLPQHPAEDSSNYQSRLHSTTLFNITELTLNSLAGRVFREALKLNDDVPQRIVDFAEDVDGTGTDVSSFGQQWFRESLAKGFADVLIDMPTLTDAEKQTRTLADDQRDNRVPVWSLLKPENVIFMYYARVGGKQVLQQARIMETECTMGPDGFTEVYTTQIRVLMPGLFEIWQDKNEHQLGGNKKPDWQMVSHGAFDLQEVPIRTFYANKKDGRMCKPPLEDLAYMNIAHWQSTSDQRNVLTVARFPILAASGTQVEKGQAGLAVGPRQLMSMRDPNGRFYYVEHSGKAIAAGAADLEELEDRMASYGAEFLRRQVSGRTAFERAQDTNEAISPLKDMALRFEKDFAETLDLTAKWMGVASDTAANPGGSVTINTKFTEEDENEAAMRTLGDARKRGDISRKTFITECARRGIVDQTLNVLEEIAQIETEFEEGPHPPTFYAGQEQIQGILGPDGKLTQKGASTAPQPVDSKGKSLLVKPKAKKSKTAK